MTDKLFESFNVNDYKKKSCVKTGFKEIDDAIIGLKGGDIMVVGATPGEAGPDLLKEIARYACVNDRQPVLFFSFETTKEEIAMRTLSASSGVSINELQNKELNDDEWYALCNSVHDSRDAEIYIDDSTNATIEYICEACGNHLLMKTQFFAEHGDNLFSIDPVERYGNWKKLTK